MERFIDKEYVLANLRERKDDCNKIDCGRVLVFAGSKGLYGAAYLTARAATKTGSGLVTLVCDSDVQKINAVRLIEEMTCNIENEDRVIGLIDRADAIAFGPGCGNNLLTRNRLRKLIKYYDGTLVIDADGINVLDSSFVDKNHRTILTPHMGEFSRLTGTSVEEIKKDRVGYAKDFAEKSGAIVVLKGKNTVVTDGLQVYTNTTGNPGMASGGMGDALTGIILSLCGQGYDNFTAACIGVYLHGFCGDYLYDDNYIVNANDLIKYIPKILKMLYNEFR